MKKIIESIRHKPVTVGLFSRPGFGKTTLLIKMADMLTAKGEKACIISLEEGEMYIRKRCAMMNIDENKFTINDSVDQSFNDIRAFVSKQTNISVIAIDYIQLMKTESASLINKLASEFNVPVIYASHLCRDLDGEPYRRIEMEDVNKVGRYRPIPTSDLFISLWRPVNIYDHYDDPCYGWYETHDPFPEAVLCALKSNVSGIPEEYIVNALFDKKTASLMFED